MHPAGERDHLPRPPSQSDKLLELTYQTSDFYLVAEEGPVRDDQPNSSRVFSIYIATSVRSRP
jgi:hypothetical protein